MMMLNQNEIEQRLQVSLMRYGLNPSDWIMTELQGSTGLQRVELTNRSEEQIKLVGKALIQKCGKQMVAVWNSLSLSTSSF